MAAHARFDKAARSIFHPSLLPPVLEYYASQQVHLKGHGEWMSALCPFHDDSKPSLRVNRQTGGYRCMACGAHGGGILDFHMRKYGLRFVEAARELGVWG